MRGEAVRVINSKTFNYIHLCIFTVCLIDIAIMLAGQIADAIHQNHLHGVGVRLREDDRRPSTQRHLTDNGHFGVVRQRWCRRRRTVYRLSRYQAEQTDQKGEHNAAF